MKPTKQQISDRFDEMEFFVWLESESDYFWLANVIFEKGILRYNAYNVTLKEFK